jgi:O-antigen/teichoic acid export membrane protein
MEDFGVYTSLVVLLAVLTPFASFGLENLGIALASRSRGAPTYIRTLAGFRALTGVLAACLFLVSALALLASTSSQVGILPLAAVAAVLFLRIHELGEHVLFAQERLRTLAAMRITALLVANASVVAALLLGGGLSLVLVLVVLEPLVLLGLLMIVLHREICEACRLEGTGGGWSTLLAHCRAALPAFASGLLVLVLLNADKLLVFRFLGQADSGLYNAAARLVDALFFIPVVIGTTHAAAFTRLATVADLKSSYWKAFRMATVATASAAAALMVLAPVLTRAIYGAQFEAAWPALAILAPALVAVTWVTLRTYALAALGRTQEFLRLTVLSCIVHLPLLAVGLWIGRVEAVAVCHTLGWIVAAMVIPLVSPTARALSPWQNLRAWS